MAFNRIFSTKNRTLRDLIAIFLTVQLCFSVALAAQPAPFSFAEETKYLASVDHNLLSLQKGKDFIGILSRSSLPRSDRNILDVYRIKNVEFKIMTLNDCSIIASRIFGANEDAGLVLSSKTIMNSIATGDICELVLKDLSSGSMFAERRMHAFIFGGKIYALVSQLNRPLDETDAADLRKFILRIRKNY